MAEYEIINRTFKEGNSDVKLSHLREWAERYPESDYQEDRTRLFMRANQQTGNLLEAISVAKELLLQYPGDFEANFTIATLTPALGDSSAEVLAMGEDAASSLIEAGQPTNLSDKDWSYVKGQILTTAHQTLGWIHMQRSDNLKAEQEFKIVLGMNPNLGQVSYWLGNVVLAQGDPDKNELALFSFARAAVYDGEGALPAEGRRQVAEYLSTVYGKYAGTQDGLAALKLMAATKALPPDNLFIESASVREFREEEAARAAERLVAVSSYSGEFDFRRTRWGQSRDEVKAAEGTPPMSEDESTLAYSTEVASMNAIAVYSFAVNKLAVAAYSFMEEHSDPSGFLSDATRLAELLGEKYGDTQPQLVWKNELYRDDHKSYGLAVSAGHLTLAWRWRTPNTHITLLLSGDNFKVSMIARYESIDLRDAQHEATVSKELENL